VDHARGVDRFQPRRGVERVAQRLPLGDSAANETRTESFTLQKLENQEDVVPGFHEAMQLYDVRVLDPGQDSHLPQESPPHFRIVPVRLREDLEGVALIRSLDEPPRVDGGRRALTEDRFDLDWPSPKALHYAKHASLDEP
jgi:hypothetical protein